jgi:large subunit ribosomal protein L4
VYSFPALEPVRLELWSPKHLSQPLRRDLLHLAVVHEGDCSRGQVNVSVKTRFEVHGSHRKVRPQKGTGNARVGDRMSPLFRGGGKTFGPRPRDFSTRMNRKVYDLAWRVALSYRYAKGDLYVVEDGLDFRPSRDFADARADMQPELVQQFLRKHTTQSLRRMGFEGTTLFVARERRDGFFEAMAAVDGEGLGRAVDLDDFDIKDLLSARRVVMERSALEEVMRRHQSDLQSRVRFADGSRVLPPPIGS